MGGRAVAAYLLTLLAGLPIGKVLPADAPAVTASVPLKARGEVDLREVVDRLCEVTGLNVARPPAGVRLPVVGVAGGLGRQMLADALGSGAKVAVERNALRLWLGASGRQERAERLEELARVADREARRQLQYGMRALKSYRPNDPARPTVCLVHGMNSSSGGFVHMVPHLEAAGFGVVVYDYPFNRSLEESGQRFEADWKAFRAQMGERRTWALVGHSMGCLVARDYVEGPDFGGDVSVLVLIAPVNQGSSVAKTQTLLQFVDNLQAVGGRKTRDALAGLGDGLGAAAGDMKPGSPYLKTLNARPRRAGVTYQIIAGDAGVLTAAARRQIEAQFALARRQGGVVAALARLASGDDLKGLLDELTEGTGDGCVAVERARLEGVSDPVILHANHAELIRAPLLFAEPGPVACMPALLKALATPATGPGG